MPIMSKHLTSVSTRPGWTISSDREREPRSPLARSSDARVFRPLSTPPDLRRTFTQDSSFRRNSTPGTAGVKAGYWSWDPEKAEVVLSPKNGILTTKSPTKAIITTKSPAMSFDPYGSLRKLTLSGLDSPRWSSSPRSIPGFQSSDTMRSLGLLPTSSLSPSSPPPLRFNSEFTGWLLPSGVDTSIPDDNYELPDLTNSSFALTNASNVDLSISTISSDSSPIPPTPGRDAGLGLGLGFAYSQLPKVFCHDGEVSETFLKEAAGVTFNSAGVSNGNAAAPAVHRSLGGRRQGTASDIFNSSTPSGSSSGGEAELNSPAISIPWRTVPNSLRSPCLSSVSPVPLIPRNFQQPSDQVISSSCQEPNGLTGNRPGGRIDSADTPKAKHLDGVHRSTSLLRRDVTLATISSSLKRSSSSAAVLSPIDRTPVISDYSVFRAKSRNLRRGQQVVEDIKNKKTVVKPLAERTVHSTPSVCPSPMAEKQGKPGTGPGPTTPSVNVNRAEGKHGNQESRRSSNKPSFSSDRKMFWR